MRMYFVSLLTASVIGAIASSLASGGAFEKYIKYIVALIMVVVIISPLKPIAESLADYTFEADLKSANAIAENARVVVEETSEKKTAEYVSGIIFEKYGIKPDSVCIDIESTETSYDLHSVSFTLPPEYESLYDEAFMYVTEKLGVSHDK